LNNKKIIVVSKRFFISGIIFFTLINDIPIPLELNNIVDNALFYTIGKVAMEKLTSTLSKMQDDTATAEDWRFAALLGEIAAVAKNRLSADANEIEFSKGSQVWVERTAVRLKTIR